MEDPLHRNEENLNPNNKFSSRKSEEGKESSKLTLSPSGIYKKKDQSNSNLKLSKKKYDENK